MRTMTIMPQRTRLNEDRRAIWSMPPALGVALATIIFLVSQPASAGLFHPAKAMNVPRAGHTATLLVNGQVLVAGGSDGTNDLTSTELFDLASGTWTPTGPLSTPRESHTATVLPSGKVLV